MGRRPSRANLVGTSFLLLSLNLSSPGQVLVVEGVDVVLANIRDSDQGAVQPGHRPVHLLQVVVVRVLLSEVVHLRRQS